MSRTPNKYIDGTKVRVDLNATRPVIVELFDDEAGDDVALMSVVVNVPTSWFKKVDQQRISPKLETRILAAADYELTQEINDSYFASSKYDNTLHFCEVNDARITVSHPYAVITLNAQGR